RYRYLAGQGNGCGDRCAAVRADQETQGNAMRLIMRQCFAALVVAVTACWLLASMACSASAEELYVVGYTDNLVRRFDAITGASLGVFATLPTNAFGPTHPLFGADGNLYVQQEQQFRILTV